MTNDILRIALVGTGPAGVFTAEELLRAKRPVSIEFFEALHHPHGLVKFGVAPDHPHTRRTAKLMDRTLAHPNVKLTLGARIGKDITIDDLKARFDAVVIATGAESDRPLGIPGSDLVNVHPSTAFAGWINGHPDFVNEPIDLACETAVIIGNGNVALDAVRMFCRSREALGATDVSPNALEALGASRVKKIHVIGRRGPVQSSFGEFELEEIGTLPDVAITVDPIVTMPSAADEKELADEKADRQRGVIKTFRAYASRENPQNPRVTVSFDFLRRPLGINGSGRVESITLELCKLEGDPGKQQAVPTGSLQKLDCGLVISAIGHRGVPIEGLPFDNERGVIPTIDNRIAIDGQPTRGLYAVGWIKRGAKGLIGHNRRDAMETAKAILEDF